LALKNGKAPGYIIRCYGSSSRAVLYLGPAILVEQDVGGFQVAVDDPIGVQEPAETTGKQNPMLSDMEDAACLRRE